jgi:hypothetical protein
MSLLIAFMKITGWKPGRLAGRGNPPAVPVVPVVSVVPVVPSSLPSLI